MKFHVSKHAMQRFDERVSNRLNIYEVLDKAKLCDEYETMGIDADYTKFTGSRKVINNRHVYFKYDDIVFACLKMNIKEYLVQTCWVKPKFEDCKIIRDDSEGFYSEEMQDTMSDIIKYLHSKNLFCVTDILKIVRGKQLPKGLRKFIKSNPYITRRKFMDYLENEPLYIRMNDDYSRRHSKSARSCAV